MGDVLNVLHIQQTLSMSFHYLVKPSKAETNSLFADVDATGLRQALLQHKEPIVSSGFHPGPP